MVARDTVAQLHRELSRSRHQAGAEIRREIERLEGLAHRAATPWSRVTAWLQTQPQAAVLTDWGVAIERADRVFERALAAQAFGLGWWVGAWEWFTSVERLEPSLARLAAAERFKHILHWVDTRPDTHASSAGAPWHVRAWVLSACAEPEQTSARLTRWRLARWRRAQPAARAADSPRWQALARFTP